MIDKTIIILGSVVLLLVLAAGGIIFYLNNEKAVSLTAVTEKNEYQMQDNLKIKIQNQSKKTICFSSCQPYTLENKEDNWKNYFDVSYCNEPNINKFCIEPLKLKAYEIDLNTVPDLKAGVHRIGLPVCVGCKANDPFREDKRFYSNEFLIK